MDFIMSYLFTCYVSSLRAVDIDLDTSILTILSFLSSSLPHNLITNSRLCHGISVLRVMSVPVSSPSLSVNVTLWLRRDM